VSFRRLTILVAFLAVFTMAVRVSIDTDTWWHLRAGAWMVEHRQILSQDVFSLTRMGQPWIYPGWLAQVLLYVVFHFLGYAGLNLFTAATVVLAFVFVWQTFEGPTLLRAFVLLLAATTSAVYWSARPQILSFVLAGLFVWILERSRAGDRRLLWILPPAMALWANLHGGFAIGLMLLGIYLAGEVLELIVPAFLRSVTLAQAWAERRGAVVALALAAIVSAAAVSLNPHGPVMLLYPFRTVSIGVLQDYIQEWQSPNFHHLEAQPFLWMLFLTVAALTFSRRRRGATEILGVVAFAYMSLLAGRNIALFALFTGPVLARHGHSALEPVIARFGRGPQIPERIARVLNLVLVALLLVAGAAKVSIPLSPMTNEQALERQLPVAAVEWIRHHHPAGPLFNSYNWGGYILWALYPDYPSFVDGRTDLFDDEILSDYLEAWRAGPEWTEVINHWGIQLALLEPEAPLATALEQSGWVRLYADGQAVVLGREGSG
jgi:hypothetical protein